MGLGVALVDRARLVKNESSGEKVEGTRVFVPTSGEWFKARLTLNAAPEVEPPSYKGEISSSIHATARSATLMYAIRDTVGSPVTLVASDRVEVNSAALGTAVYEVTGDPEPIRKKRAVIGWTATLTRANEHRYEQVA